MPRGRPVGYKKVDGTWRQVETPTSTPTSTPGGPPLTSKSTPNTSTPTPSASTSTPSASTEQVKLQRCVVCYVEYHPFHLPSDEWESSKMKMFYHILNIGGSSPSPSSASPGGPPTSTSNEGKSLVPWNGCGPGNGPGNDENNSSSDEDEENDDIISLPFCPYCTSRVSVMYSLHCQLQETLSRFDSIRDDVAFTVCETISKNDKNDKNGPMDHIREKIFQIWNPRCVELKDAGKPAETRGLNSIAIEYSKGKFHFDKKMFSNRALDTSFDTSTNSGSGRSQPMIKVKASLNDTRVTVNDRIDQELRATVVPVTNDISQSKKKRRRGSAKVLNANASPGYESVESMLEMEIHNQSVGNNDNEQGQEEGEILYSNNLSLAPNQIHTYHGFNRSSTKLQDSKNKNGSTSPPRMPKLIPMGKIASPVKQKRSRAKTGYYEYVPVVTNTNNEPDLPTPGTKRRRVPKKAFNIGGESPKFRSTPFGMKKQIEFKNTNQELVSNSHKNTEYDNFDDDDDDSSLMIDESLPNANTTISRKKESQHGLAGVYKCRLCSRSYFEISRLKRHESIVHPSAQNFRCKYCPKGFSSQLTLRRHVQLIHHQTIAGSIKCLYCKKTFVKHLAYVQHVQIVHPGEKIRSNIPLNLNIPAQNSKNSKNSLSKKIKMEMQSPTHNNNEEEIMEIMDEDLDFDGEELDDEDLMDINSSGGGDGLSKFTCDICGVSFPYKGLLDLHTAAHFKKNNPMQCNDCGKVFTKDRDFKKHLSVAHKKRMKCPRKNCKAFYYRTEMLADHIRIAHGTKGRPKGNSKILALEWKAGGAGQMNNVEDAAAGNTTGETEDFEEDSSSEKSLQIDDN